MGLSRDDLAQLQRFLRPLITRVANTVARAVVQLADDGTKLQLLQLGVLAGETVDNAEHHQPYGFASVPLGGAEAVVVFPNGDRSHPLVVSVSDRRYRPTAGEAGQVTMYHYNGAKVTMLESGDIELQPGPGGQVYVRDEGGSAEPLVKRSEFLGHTHLTAGNGTPSEPVAGATLGDAGTFPGTERLQSQ